MTKYDLNYCRFHKERQIKPEALGSASMNFKIYSSSSPRNHMFGSHLAQKPALINGEMPLLMTGSEREYGARLIKIKAPADAIVKAIINRSPNNHYNSGQSPPATIVVFERMDTHKIDCLVVPHNYCNHQTFGFRFVRTDLMNRLSVGDALREGDVLAAPPSAGEDNDWNYCMNVRTALMPSEAGIEDGLCISESLANSLAMYGYSTVEMRFSPKKIPLNLYGGDTSYIPWPKVGDVIGSSGIIMASRDYDIDLAPSNFSRTALRRPNQTDDIVYGVAGARIVDIKIRRVNNFIQSLPQEIEDYISIFTTQEKNYQKNILRMHDEFKRIYGSDVYPMEPVWNATVTEALKAQNSHLLMRKDNARGSNPEEVHVIIQYEYIVIPKRGGKFAGRQGDKAVVTKIKPDHLMPRCSRGIIHSVMDDSSVSNRMNPPNMDEMFINSCAETAYLRAKDVYEKDGNIEEAFDILKTAQSYVSPLLYKEMDLVTSIQEKEDVLIGLFRDYKSLPVLCPVDNPVDYLQALPAFASEFPPCYEELTLYSEDGVPCKTKFKTLVGYKSYIPNDRQSTGFAACSSPKKNHHGIPVKPSKSAKQGSPVKDSPTRTDGEDDFRGKGGIAGGIATAEIMARSTGSADHLEECRSIYNAANPARILNSVPRTPADIDPTVKRQQVIKLTSGRPAELRDHVLLCGGVAIVPGEDGDAV